MSQDPKSGLAADEQQTQTPNSTNDSETSEAKEQRRKEELEKAKKEEEDKPVSSGSGESDTLGQNSWFENDGTSGIDMP